MFTSESISILHALIIKDVEGNNVGKCSMWQSYTSLNFLKCFRILNRSRYNTFSVVYRMIEAVPVRDFKSMNSQKAMRGSQNYCAGLNLVVVYYESPSRVFLDITIIPIYAFSYKMSEGSMQPNCNRSLA